jgi:hypothetical protein
MRVKDSRRQTDSPSWSPTRCKERRHTTSSTSSGPRDQDEAAEVLKELLGLGDGSPPGIVPDMQIARLTGEARDGIATCVAHLRRMLDRE